MFNPRFPHKMHVLRARVLPNGDLAYGADGRPIYDRLTLTLVEMSDSEPVRDADGNFVKYTADEVAFGYRTSSQSTSRAGDVVQADFKLACPMFLTELRPDDVLVLKDYEREFRAVVVKKTTFNLGTNVWVNEARN